MLLLTSTTTRAAFIKITQSIARVKAQATLSCWLATVLRMGKIIGFVKTAGVSVKNITTVTCLKVSRFPGSSWGESGYFRIARGVNLCNFGSEATYPKLA